MRRRLLAWLAVLSLLFAGTVLVAPSAVARPYCGQAWSSLAKSDPGMSAGRLTDVRAGRHDCFDRLVLDVSRPLTGWSVQYVTRVVADGSGRTVAVRGGARLEVVARVGADPHGQFLVRPGTRLVSTAGFRTFRDVVWAGSFEGVSTVGLGVRARLPFRAFVLPGPGHGSRLVVDVAHRW
jgi:hypothetical protein